jgi:hypothetical protein
LLAFFEHGKSDRAVVTTGCKDCCWRCNEQATEEWEEHLMSDLSKDFKTQGGFQLIAAENSLRWSRQRPLACRNNA